MDRCIMTKYANFHFKIPDKYMAIINKFENNTSTGEK